jgi:hypothetical protein
MNMRLRLLRLWLCLMLSAGAARATAQSAPGWGLEPLMHDLAQTQSASAHFTERKTIHLLTAPLLASGTLTYAAPDYLRKTTISPVPEDFVLDHGKITITGGPDNQTHHFAVGDDPRIGGLVEGIRATLAGDLPTLERFYTVQLSGTTTDWQLDLLPRNADLAHFIKWILIRGSQGQISTIDTASSNGDLSEMSITEDQSDAR